MTDTDCKTCENTRISGFYLYLNRSDGQYYIGEEHCKDCTTYQELHCAMDEHGVATPMKPRSAEEYEKRKRDFINQKNILHRLKETKRYERYIND